jgi:hypothetical protein
MSRQHAGGYDGRCRLGRRWMPADGLVDRQAPVTAWSRVVVGDCLGLVVVEGHPGRRG